MSRGARQIIDGLLILLFAACVARLWLAPLPSSLWVDEMVTVFVVQHPGHPSLAIAPQVPESIYYWLPRVSQTLFGASEAAYRAPSILIMLVALFFVWRMAAKLIHPHAGWFAVFACLAIHGVDYAAIDARPYGLGMAVSAAALLFLVRWFDAGRWADMLLFALCAALLWRVHLIFWPFYFVFVVYWLIRLRKRDLRATAPQTGAAAVLVGAALVPVLLKSLAILRGARMHVIAPLPDLRTLEHSFHWNLILICGAGAFVLAKLLEERPAARPVSQASLVLILSWWLCQPVVLFLYSRVTGNSVFIPRYVSLMLPGIALAATVAVAFYLSPQRWKHAAVVLGAGALAVMGQWNVREPQHDHSEWRSAALEENRLAADPKTPVICTSPFIEARWPVWNSDYQLPGFLYAHLPYYPIRGKLYLFPYISSPEAEQFAADLLQSGRLNGYGRFMIYGPAGNVRYWRNWFLGRPELKGWSFEMKEFGDIYLGVFKLSPAAPVS